jgi:hypothetical protein
MKRTRHVRAAVNYGRPGKTLVTAVQQQSEPPVKEMVRTLAAGALAVALSSTAHADDIVPSVMSPPAHTDLHYDAVRATLTTPGNTLDVFYARPVRVRPYEFDDDVPADNYFGGIYDTWKVPGAWAKAMKTKLEMSMSTGRA